MPITSTPSSVRSATIAQILVVPMSRPTIRSSLRAIPSHPPRMRSRRRHPERPPVAGTGAPTPVALPALSRRAHRPGSGATGRSTTCSAKRRSISRASAASGLGSRAAATSRASFGAGSLAPSTMRAGDARDAQRRQPRRVVAVERDLDRPRKPAAAAARASATPRASAGSARRCARRRLGDDELRQRRRTPAPVASRERRAVRVDQRRGVSPSRDHDGSGRALAHACDRRVGREARDGGVGDPRMRFEARRRSRRA